MITVLTCRGTGEPVGNPSNMLARLTAMLDPAKFEIGPDIGYPASIGPANSSGNPFGPSEDQSVAAGLPELAAAIRATPNLVLPLGYSLGGVLLSRFLELQAQGAYADCELAGAAFVAPPCRAPGEGIDAGMVGEGINGVHGPWPHIPTWSAANPNDGITSCPVDSPLRQLAAGMSGLTFATLSWTPALALRLINGEWPTAVYSPGELLRAGQLMLGYLFGGTHTSAYLSGGYLQRLADHINTQLP